MINDTHIYNVDEYHHKNKIITPIQYSHDSRLRKDTKNMQQKLVFESIPLLFKTNV